MSRLAACLQGDLLEVDVLLDVALERFEKQAAVGVVAVLPHRVQEIVAHLQSIEERLRVSALPEDRTADREERAQPR